MAGVTGVLRRVFGRRRSGDDERPAVALDDVRRRLELLLAAVYGRAVPIVAAGAPEPPGRLARLFRPVPPHLEGAELLAASDGERIHLPPSLDAEGGAEAALARYRLLAIEQAERLARGTAAHLPADDPLARDLYLLRESAAVDGAIARAVPGVLPALAAERAAALARRPAPAALTPPEREVEALVRRLLGGDPAEPPADLPADGGPEDSLAWARETAAWLRAGGERYRGVPPVAAWGTVVPGPAGDAPAAPIRTIRPLTPINPDPTSIRISRFGVGFSRGGGEAVEPRVAYDDPFAASGKKVADPGGQDKTGSADDAADASADDPPPRDEPGTPGSARAPGTAKAADGSGREGIDYPEWDYRAGRHRRPGATVRLAPPAKVEPEWADTVLRHHAALIRRLREQFERLRARRTRLSQQKDGDELDLAACVRALVDVRAGHAVDDRMYAAVRPARRELAILLLVDISGSTSEPAGEARIIDVEKVALLLIGEALDALGDRYAVLTFSGRGAAHVRLKTVKDFAEPSGEAVRRRISALRPEGFTRMGAAIRHAAALLARQGTGHRLLLILSDGKPHDEDGYDGRYGIEDARQAIAEARAQGVFPFCLTVDRKASAYLPRIFGTAGHVILRRPDQLPLALVKVVRHLLRSR